ncbi:hypothetical protein PAHAL_6G152100 [Panicum hallii]|uniref:Uncharacterized protein n=1 Tax=Panicum hallii TaxID=206008 RepID=A0A2T8IGD3_9POAL|nr:hypothetical protein PAHAL_6G152100 [Panicum hallii]
MWHACRRGIPGISVVLSLLIKIYLELRTIPEMWIKCGFVSFVHKRIRSDRS